MTATMSQPLRDRIMERVTRSVGPDRWRRYFGPGTTLTCEPKGVRVAVSSPFLAELLGKRFESHIREAVRLETGAEPEQVRYTIDAPRAVGNETHSATAIQEPQPRPATSAASHRRPRSGSHSQLRHRLDRFIVGPSNELAHHAAMRIIEPDCPREFSPLFVHGSCGLGKTHLLQGLARECMKRHPGITVRYTTGEAFTNRFITAVRNHDVDAFRRSYRAVDLLCIDDIHFLSNKKATQAEFLHTFNAIGMDGARVVLASDEHPSHIRQFSRELLSRFVSGMVVRIDTPDLAMRIELARRLSLRRGMTLDEDALRAVASRCRESVREIEGALTRIDAMRRLTPNPVAADLTVRPAIIRRALGPVDHPRPTRPIRSSAITEHVCRTLGVDLSELLGGNRHKRVVLARSIASYLSRQLTTMSFPEIARALGRPNHSTVVTACKRVQRQIDEGASCGAGPELDNLSLEAFVQRLAREIVQQAPVR